VPADGPWGRRRRQGCEFLQFYRPFQGEEESFSNGLLINFDEIIARKNHKEITVRKFRNRKKRIKKNNLGKCFEA